MNTNGELDRDFIAKSVRRGIIIAVAAVVILLLLWLLKSALTPLAVAFVFAYFLDPLIDRFEARRIPRRIAILFLVAVSGIVAVAMAVFVVPKLLQEIAHLAAKLPGYLNGAITAINPWFESWFGIAIPTSIREGLESFKSSGASLPLESLRRLIEQAVQGVTGTLGSAIALLVIPVITYYALLEFDNIKAWFLGLVPVEYREAVDATLSMIDDLVSGFIRGQLIVAVLLGILYAVGFSVIGIDMAIGIGMIAGMLGIIPYVGSAVALALAAGLCLLQYGVGLQLLFVVGWYALVQTLEGLFLTPRIVGQSVGIHPVAVIVGLLIGGDLLGFLGLIVAVPATAIIQVFVAELLETYRSSTLYSGSTEPPG
ncbi:MAG: AI-2E family transporter [Deltaproteobacteria bacterium]|nr:AI-2E family transporter [Deltaproteobacteria bacterium]